MTKFLILGFLAISTQAFGRDWFASPTAGMSGTGSLANPWPLPVALNQTANIKPGDTLYLRGGVYPGPGFVSTLAGTANSYVTVRSYPGEWAVISDRGNRVLLTALG